MNASRLGALATIARAGSDQFPLELRKATQDREHQPAMWGRGVGPGVSEALESRAGFGDRVEHVEQVPRRTGQPIEPRDQEDIAGLEGGEGTSQCLPIAGA